MSKTKNVFISHIHKDDSKLADLKTLVKKQGYEFRDSSITSEKPNRAKDPDYIMNSILKPQIDWAGTMIVLITPDTHKSDWVNKEIEYAQQTDTRIVGVWAEGAKEADLPENLDKFADAIVGWDSQSIVDAVDGEDNHCGPDGAPSQKRPIERKACQA